MSNAFNNLIQFPLTPDMIAYWTQTSIKDFIDTNGYLNLRINKQDYSLITEGKGLVSKLGYREAYGEKEIRRFGFRVKIRSNNEDLYLLMVELANYTAGENCHIQPIEVIDYHHRHNRVDRDRCYRLRTGVFEGEFTNVMGTATQGHLDCDGHETATGSKFGSGFSFKFMETVKEGYF